MSFGLALRRLRWELPRTAGNARLSFREREGLEVSIRRGDEVLGLGEASPLPGYSDDSLSECEAALAAFDPEQLPALISAVERHDFHAAESTTSALPPAARFGLESAALDATARIRGTSLAAALGAKAQRTFVPALLIDAYDGRDVDAILAEVEAGQRRAVKLKIGRDTVRELALATELRRKLPLDVELRFDANRSLAVGRDDAFVCALAALEPCLLEEPFATDAMPHAFALSLPLALDESLRAETHERVSAAIASGRVRGLVLKPTILGLIGAVAWAETATRAGGRAIPSHTYEGAVGRRFLSAFAQLCGEMAPGLDDEVFSARLPGPVVAE